MQEKKKPNLTLLIKSEMRSVIHLCLMPLSYIICNIFRVPRFPGNVTSVSRDLVILCASVYA